MASLTQQFRSKAQARVRELTPAVNEYHELMEFLAITGDGKKVATAKPKPKAKSKAKPKAKAKTRSRKRTATKATGKRRGRKPVRANQFTKLIQENPGMTIRQASKKMSDVNETYLHRIGKDLVSDGTLRKEGSAYYPVEATKEPVEAPEAPVEDTTVEDEVVTTEATEF